MPSKRNQVDHRVVIYRGRCIHCPYPWATRMPLNCVATCMRETRQPRVPAFLRLFVLSTSEHVDFPYLDTIPHFGDLPSLAFLSVANGELCRASLHLFCTRNTTFRRRFPVITNDARLIGMCSPPYICPRSIPTIHSTTTGRLFIHGPCGVSSVYVVASACSCLTWWCCFSFSASLPTPSPSSASSTPPSICVRPISRLISSILSKSA